MKALSGVVLALTAAMAGAFACSDSSSTKSNAAGRGGQTSDAGEGGQATSGASSGEGGTVAEGGDTNGPGAGAGGGAGAGLDSAGFCDAYLDTLCTWAETCSTFDDCTDWAGYIRFEQECMDARASEDAGFVGFDPDAAAECLELVELNNDCVSGFPPFFLAPVQAACRGVFAGTVDAGDECASADFASVFDECADGYCERDQQQGSGMRECLGTCVGYAQENDDCSSGQVCEPGLVCGNGTCQPPAGVGDSCSGVPCEAGLICVGFPQSCRQQGEVGDACTDLYDCQFPAGCAEETGVCTLELGEGEVCTDNSMCSAELYCDLDGLLGVCTERIEPSGACEPFQDTCVEDYACSLVEPYVCVEAVGAVDEPCGPEGCEGDLWCDYTEPFVGTCRERVEQDGACTSDISCIDGLYCVGSDPKCGPTGGEDEPCAAFTPESCEEGLFCARDTLTCTPPREVGETCNPYVPEASCEEGLYCACLSPGCPGTTSVHQPEDVCVAKHTNGQACQSDHECSSGYCAGGECADEPEPPAPMNCSR